MSHGRVPPAELATLSPHGYILNRGFPGWMCSGVCRKSHQEDILTLKQEKDVFDQENLEAGHRDPCRAGLPVDK